MGSVRTIRNAEFLYIPRFPGKARLVPLAVARQAFCVFDCHHEQYVLKLCSTLTTMRWWIYKGESSCPDSDCSLDQGVIENTMILSNFTFPASHFDCKQKTINTCTLAADDLSNLFARSRSLHLFIPD